MVLIEKHNGFCKAVYPQGYSVIIQFRRAMNMIDKRQAMLAAPVQQQHSTRSVFDRQSPNYWSQK